MTFGRRIFLVKQGFQARFALYPIFFFALFLFGAGLYLEAHLREALEFQLYLPHSRLENSWALVAPILAETGIWGGAGFIAALGMWGCARFVQLRADLNRLADWTTALAAGHAPEPPPAIRDAEVRALATALHRAAASFETWDRAVAGKVQSLSAVVEVLERAEPAEGLRAVREAWMDLQGSLAVVRVDEELG
jgi:HAMP domain-containing protein